MIIIIIVSEKENRIEKYTQEQEEEKGDDY